MEDDSNQEQQNNLSGLKEAFKSLFSGRRRVTTERELQEIIEESEETGIINEEEGEMNEEEFRENIEAMKKGEESFFNKNKDKNSKYV